MMENNNIDLKNALDLYESLDVSEKAKETFFKNIVLKEAEAISAEDKKVGWMVAFGNFFKKKWGGTQGIVNRMYKALDGMSQAIDASSNITDKQKAEYKQYLETYKAKIQTNIKAVMVENKNLEDANNKDPKGKNLNLSARVIEKQNEQATAKIDASTNVATLTDAIAQAYQLLVGDGNDADINSVAVDTITESVNDKLDSDGFINAETVAQDKEIVTKAMGSANELLKPVYQSIIDALGGANNAISEEAAKEATDEATDGTPEEGSVESSSENEEGPSSDGASHDIIKAEREKRDAKEKGKDPADIESSDENGANGMDESVKPNEARI